MGGQMIIKLPPRFKIFHNVSEDYYLVYQRFYLFWYIAERRDVGYDAMEVIRHATLEEAETYISQLLEHEKQSKIPDEIKLVKEL
jgi:hypothetical protein